MLRVLKELYHFHFRDERRERLFLASLSFVVTFAIVRGITHAIRAGVGPFHNVSSGGLHIHHLVWGIVLLLVYSLGLAVPFVVAALAVERFIEWFQRYRRYMPVVTKLSGAFLVLVGVLLGTGSFSRLASVMQSWTPEFLRSRL